MPRSTQAPCRLGWDVRSKPAAYCVRKDAGLKVASIDDAVCAILLPHSPRRSAQRSHTSPEGSLHNNRLEWLLPPMRREPPASKQLCEAGLSDELACTSNALKPKLKATKHR
jgi:hypothetical protein